MGTEEKSQKTKSVFNVLIGIALIICIVLLAQFAWAKYMSSVKGSTSADIARWNIKVNEKTNASFSIKLADTRKNIVQEAEVQDGYIGPGTAGVFEIKVDAENTDVSLEYDINLNIDFKDNTKFPKNLIFYSDLGMKNAIYHSDTSINLKGYIAQNDSNKVKSHIIYWKWDFETGQTQKDRDDNNEADSFWIGEEISIPITVVGQQVSINPTENQCEVTFDANGGTIEGYGNSEILTKMITDEQYGELPIPIRDGYKFDGWVGKNIFDKSQALNQGIRNETPTQLWADTILGNNWVKSNLKANTMYTMSYDVECTKAPDSGEQRPDGNGFGLILYVWRRRFCISVRYRIFRRGAKGTYKKNFYYSPKFKEYRNIRIH